MEERERSAQERAYEIRQRAYQIWEREGRPMGRDKEHWLQAERELAREQGRAEPEEAQDIQGALEYEREVKNFARHYRLETVSNGARRIFADSRAKSPKDPERAARRSHHNGAARV